MKSNEDAITLDAALERTGILLVSYPWGYISDTKGRRYSLIISVLVGSLLSSLSSLASNWIVLGLIKFLSVCFSCAAHSASYTLLGESCVQRVRSKYMLIITCLIILSPAIPSLVLEGSGDGKHKTLWQSLHEQTAPLFRPPMLWRTLQLYFIVFVVYITNNSFLIWLPYVLNLVRLSLSTSDEYDSFCHLISLKDDITNGTTSNNATDTLCVGKVEDNVIITLVISQLIFSFLTIVISYLMKWRRIVLLTILLISALSGLLINLMPEPISSVVVFMMFTCTNLGMGILASYFVDLYPTSYRGMVTCLSIMVGRTSTFIGINTVGNLLFSHCENTFYMWSLLVFSILVSSYPWGFISDTKGRRYSLIISALVGSLLSSLSSLASNWIVLGLIKFVSVCFSCAANSVTYTLLGESCVQIVRRKYMLIITCILILSPGAAAVLTYPTLLLDFKLDIPFLNLTFTPWRLLIIVLALPTGLGGIAIWFFCESPKFLANYGREDEALEITSLVLEGSENAKHQSLWQSLHEQSAPLFRPPMLWRTLQLYFIVLVVYITNNSFLVWLPYLLNLVIQNLKTSGEYNSFCHLITLSQDTPNENTFSNSTDVPICKGKVESNVIITLVISQSIFSFLTFVISYLMKWRRIVLLTNLSIAALSGFLINLMPDPVLSIVALMVFTSTNLAMGILASYFVDLYPTSCRFFNKLSEKIMVNDINYNSNYKIVWTKLIFNISKNTKQRLSLSIRTGKKSFTIRIPTLDAKTNQTFLGNGLYNTLLVATCGLIMLGIGIDMFGFSLVVAAACDLNLNVTQKGILTSLPLIGILVASYPWGYISDTKGRRYSLIISVLVGSLLSSLSMLTYPTLLLNFKIDIPFLSLTFTPWRLLIIVLALPAGLGGIAICFFCESPKFLANYGREDEAVEISSLVLEGSGNGKHQSLWQSLREQTAPLFRPPMLWRTLQLYYIVFVVYITNNSFLMWLPFLLNLVPICDANVEDNVIITLVVSQSIFAFLIIVISYLMKWRRILLLTILVIAALGGFLINLMPEPVSSVVALMVFTGTNLGMGILASYFVDLYPTSCR
ncbi:unnamed protein product [Leptidea sinapis]|uniref:Major facilitator superfamily (MFS) profile domain-containing protein n=1 Tax=Leptidea sinapis TaxID=189913 RepID=A0A5E4R6P2_9NEOP|nr:unnamed protein product [Leptidea sinapis]